MKNFILLAIVFFIQQELFSQDISGNWLSEDTSRIYSIYKTRNSYEAKIFSSSRENDKEGILIIRKAKKKKNKYKGIIIAVDDGLERSVIITTDRKKVNTLKLKIRRLIIFPVTIYWHKQTVGQNS
ncbi:MAG: hypothetical protein H6549_01700 [Chitinophagales bacterium]|nr:hypothetical protein [Chitinophagales bacterium]